MESEKKSYIKPEITQDRGGIEQPDGCTAFAVIGVVAIVGVLVANVVSMANGGVVVNAAGGFNVYVAGNYDC